eukprot:CAMPEP_0182428296 /NCGR_PEP_ID=MMETSP1167-20130531/22079_1 /TAXON_ID=2988 /ORGANISM="Mallomonas Sp, Strain CCMP3275" /LENGTH=162 /DNA_ID=CAMNT_0024611097 /DNA_START=305 /DNA_END=793 /DNA_ORIENTATION=-
MALVAFILYFAMLKMIQMKADKTKIWVPPKEQPKIPFMPAPEPPKPEDYEETTFEAHETKLVYEAVQALAMACGIAAFVSYKFEMHVSCIIQAVTIPTGFLDFPVFQKYFLGSKSNQIYKELYEKPEGRTGGANMNITPSDDPRVEQLPDEAEVDVAAKKDK